METRCSFRFCPILFLKKAPAYHLWVEEGRLEVEMEAIRKAERSPVAFNSQFICSHLYSLPFGFSYLFFPFPTTFICSNFPNTSYFYLLFLLFAATLDYSIFNLPQFQFSPFSLMVFPTTALAIPRHTYQGGRRQSNITGARQVKNH